jgi:hypothetical protein
MVAGLPLGAAPAAMQMAPAKPARFSMTSAFWETLEKDADVKKEFNERVEKRAREIIDTESAPQRAAIYDGAREQGLAEGLAEARQEAQKLFADLEAASGELLKQKEALLHAHERLWCEAITHLSRRFLIPLGPERLVNLKTWLEDSIGDLTRQSKIRVLMAPSVFERVQSSGIPGASHWEWAEDKTLTDKELRVELVGGGLLFSPQAEAEKLSEKLSELLGANANGT